MAYLLANTTILSEAEANLTPFLLNAPFVAKHSIWFGYGGIPLLTENLVIIEQELKRLGHDLPSLFKNRRELFRLCKRMLNKNRFYRTGLITFQFFLNADKIDFIVTAKAFTQSDFQINSQNLLATVSELKEFSHSPNYNSMFAKAPLWQQINALYNEESQAAIILNEKQAICEGPASNIFMIKKDVLFTPSLETGCYSDVLRSEIIKIAENLQLQIAESDNLEIKHLIQMDEVFFASEAKGIQWILGFENRRFVHEYTDKIYTELNKFLGKKVEDQK